MGNIKDKEKIVRGLVNTFHDRNELHIAYKKRMKVIFSQFIDAFVVHAESLEDHEADFDIAVFIDRFVEERFKSES
jgi:hypothetical protein